MTGRDPNRDPAPQRAGQATLGVGYLRMSGPYVQSAVGDYRDRTGRIITLICCLHMAQPPYYARIRTLLTGLDVAGSVVHGEGAPLLPTPDPSDDERRVLDKMHHYRDMERQVLARRGWVGRYDALTYHPRWQIVDLSLLDVIRRAGLLATEQYADRLVATYTTALSCREATTLLWQMEDNVLRAACTTPHPGVGHSILSDVVVRQRAQTALDAIASTNRDLVLLWGPAQMPDLHAGLDAQGFTLIREQGWLTAARLALALPPATGATGGPA